MKKKYLGYAILPVMGLALLGAGQASAHGWFKIGSSATPQEVAQQQTTMFQQQAAMLGVSVDEVKNAWASGKTLQELATEKGITEEQLQAKMQEQRQAQMKAHLQTLVDQDVITQAQADQRLQFMQTKGLQGMGKGMRLMHRGMMGL